MFFTKGAVFVDTQGGCTNGAIRGQVWACEVFYWGRGSGIESWWDRVLGLGRMYRLSRF